MLLPGGDMKGLMLAVATAAVLTGCGGEPTIDATSEEALRKSIVEVSLPLSEDDRSRLANAVLVIVRTEAEEDPNLAELPEIARLKIHGLTAQEAISLGETIEAEQEARAEAKRKELRALFLKLIKEQVPPGMERLRREQEERQREIARVEAEIVRTKEKMAEWKSVIAARATDAEVLQRMILINAVQIERLNNTSLAPNNITVTLTNKSDKAISKIHFRGRIVVDGRTTPYDEGNLYMRPELGIEPGETLTVTNRANELHSALKAVPADSGPFKLEVVPVYAEDAQGEVLWNGLEPVDAIRSLRPLEDALARLEHELRALSSQQNTIAAP